MRAICKCKASADALDLAAPLLRCDIEAGSVRAAVAGQLDQPCAACRPPHLAFIAAYWLMDQPGAKRLSGREALEAQAHPLHAREQPLSGFVTGILATPIPLSGKIKQRRVQNAQLAARRLRMWTASRLLWLVARAIHPDVVASVLWCICAGKRAIERLGFPPRQTHPQAEGLFVLPVLTLHAQLNNFEMNISLHF